MCSCSCETFCFAACCRLARGHAGALNGSTFEAARAQKQSPVARGRDSINGHFQRRWNYGGNLPTNIIRNIRTILPQVLEFYCQSGAQQGPLGPRNRFLHFLAGGPWVPGNIPSLFDRGALGPRIPPFSDRGLLGSRIPSLFGRGSLRLRFLPFLFSSLPRMIMNQALALLHKRLYHQVFASLSKSIFSLLNLTTHGVGMLEKHEATWS